MKKFISSLMIFAFTAGFIVVSAQENPHHHFYLGADGGQASPAFRDAFTTYYDNSIILDIYTPGYKTIKMVSGSLGAGQNADLYAGYTLNDNLAIELGGVAFRGSTVEVIDTGTTGWVLDQKWKAHVFRWRAGVNMSFSIGKFHPYVRMAYVLGMNVHVDDDVYIRNEDGSTQYIERPYTGKMFSGFNGGAGVKFDLPDRFSVFAELSVYAQQWAPERRRLTLCKYNDVDMTASVPPGDCSNVNYYDHYSYGPSIQPSPVTEEVKFYFPLSSLGFNMGVEYKFGKMD